MQVKYAKYVKYAGEICLPIFVQIGSQTKNFFRSKLFLPLSPGLSLPESPDEGGGEFLINARG